MKVRYIICEICGKKIRDNFHEDSHIHQKMLSESLCYECAYWKYLIDNWQESYHVINGVLYDFQPYYSGKKLNVTLGSNGKRYHILTFDGKVVRSNDVWVKGAIPQRFRGRLKDDAYYISEKSYMVMGRRKHICDSKGCYDRYHCFFYDYRSEYKSGPYNVIPQNWVAGNEHCKTFVDIRSIKNFNAIVDSEHFLDIMKKQENEKVHLSKDIAG